MKIGEGIDLGRYSPNRAKWLLITFLLMGVFFRVYNFWQPSLWLDEYGSWWVTAAPTWLDTAERALKYQEQSPLYYFVVRSFTSSLGYTPFSLRLPSVIFGVFTLALAYPLAMRIFQNRHTALLATLVFAFSEKLIYVSQYTGPYSVALFLTLLSFVFFLRVIQLGDIRDRIGYVISSTLIVYVHFLFSFVVVIQLIYLVCILGWRRAVNKEWFRLFALVFICSLPTVPQLLDLFQRRQTVNWMSTAHFSDLIAVGADVLFGFYHPGIFIMTVLVVIILGFKWEEQYKDEVRTRLKLPVIWVGVTLPVFAFLPEVWGVTLFYGRYMLFALPAVFLLMAWFMANLRATDFRIWIPPVVFSILTIGVTFLPALRGSGVFAQWEQWPWKDAATILAASYKPDDVVLLRTGLVDAERLTHESEDAELSSFVNWPILAHLPPGTTFNIVTLPFLPSRGNIQYLKAVFERASKHARVWVIGNKDVADFFRSRLLSDWGYRVAQESTRGELQIFLFKKPPVNRMQ
jgi:uncharacterized membrane protein